MSNTEIKDRIIAELLFLGKELSVTFDFKYLTIQWSEGMNSPIVQLWTSRPKWTKMYEDYGVEHEGWHANEMLNWNVTMSTECLKGDFTIQNLGKEFNFKDYLIIKKEIDEYEVNFPSI